MATLLGLASLSALAEDVYSHSMGNDAMPMRFDTQTYFMKPGDTATGDMRVCAMIPEQLVVNNVTFKGNNSDWAKVDEKQFPVTAALANNLTSSANIPVTVAVPSNFTGDHALIQTVVEAEAGVIALPLEGELRVIISNATVSQQDLPECKSLMDIQTSMIYNVLILGLPGAGLGAVGYFAYSRSKKKSQKQKASIGAKTLLILLSIVAFFLITGAFLFLLPLF
jgi:hypothetical protein